MAASQDEFRDLLAEFHVDLDKLKTRAEKGVPQEVRGDVWKLLLDVKQPDKTEEASLQKELTARYAASDKTNPELVKQVRGAIRRYQPEMEFFRSSRVQDVMERVVMAFTNNITYVSYDSKIVSLLAPFVYCIQDNEAELFFCFQGFVERLEVAFPMDDIQIHVAHFIALFSTLMPELYNCFDQEEVEPNDWCVSWISCLLCRELPLRCVLRLWDVYFAREDGVSLHIYICLAILQHISDDLLELNEGVEMLAVLQHLPVIELDHIVTSAQMIKGEVQARGLV